MYHLLIVDDEANIAEGLADLFRRAGLPLERIETAYSASQALERCQVEPVDIVISDIRMPGMSGLELLERMRETWRHAIVIFLTGYADFEYAKRALRGQAFDYLLKPADDEDVVAAVERAIAAHDEEMRPTAVRDATKPEREKPALPKRATDDAFLQGLQAFIAANLDRDLSLETLAGRFYVNPSYLSRIFHQQAGEQLSQYIERRKMEAAKSLLADARLKVYEVAVRVGYRNPNYFAKVYRKSFGVSPHEYRMQIGVEQDR
ncbi:response regulator [Paenibacillus antri]|uniref:Response regulator n=1 Tax=Paenibacillus antri TaxID=2582848 RepID=A0A5R9G588_9BACL|nr:response regulator [Paenibacillus antri]TLS49496.1 response regulator [Paenibacillus antri]